MARTIAIQIGLMQPPDVITHGSQLIGGESTLVGYTSYLDPGLGRKLILGDLVDWTGSTHVASDFLAGPHTGSGVQGDPYVFTKLHTDRIRLDIPWCTFKGCLSTSIYNDFSGTHHPGLGMEFVTFDPPVPDGEQNTQWEDYYALRCLFQGDTDGARANGGTVIGTMITESIIKTKAVDGGDHNDGVQLSGGAGNVTFDRVLLYMETMNIAQLGSSGMQFADMTSGTTMHAAVHDSYLVGKSGADNNEILRCYDGGLTSNITYEATGNVFDLSLNRSRPYLGRGTSNTTPMGQVAWSENFDDLGNPLSLI